MDATTRTLRLFVDIKKREVEPALLFFFFWFLVIIVFWILRPLKSGLFIEHLGARVELYAKLSNIGVAILAVVAFSWLYNRLGSRRLIPALCLVFVLALLGFAAMLSGAGPPSTGVIWAFYLFGDLWSTVWVTTFWAFLNEMTSTEQGKRLYGLIGGGGIIGGLVGALAVAVLVVRFGGSTLILGCAVITVLLGVIAWRTEVLARLPRAPISRGRSTDHLGLASEKKNAAIEGAKLATASRYIFAIIMIVFLYEIVSQILDYQYKTATEVLEGAAATQAFFGRIGVITNTLSIITQFFLVSFIIRKFGMKTALLFLPVAMLMASGLYFVVPVLWTASVLTVSDNAFAYSINQTSRETLFAPTSSDVKYKARAFANMLVQRLGKGVAILMALALGMVPIRFLSLLGAGVIVIWSGYAIYAGRRFDKLTRDEAERRPEKALG